MADADSIIAFAQSASNADASAATAVFLSILRLATENLLYCLLPAIGKEMSITPDYFLSLVTNPIVNYWSFDSSTSTVATERVPK